MLITERPTPVFAWLVLVDGPDRSSIGRVYAAPRHNEHWAHTRQPDRGNDDTCSAQHARIRREAKEDEDPTFVLYDMGSRNGTFVGDKKTYKDPSSQRYRHELLDGDYLLIGETTLAFKKLYCRVPDPAGSRREGTAPLRQRCRAWIPHGSESTGDDRMGVRGAFE